MSKSITVKNVRVSRDTVVDVTFRKNKKTVFCLAEGFPTIEVVPVYDTFEARIHLKFFSFGTCHKIPAKAFAKAVKEFWAKPSTRLQNALVSECLTSNKGN